MKIFYYIRSLKLLHTTKKLNMDKEQKITCKKIGNQSYRLQVPYHRFCYEKILNESDYEYNHIIPIQNLGKALRKELEIPNMIIQPMLRVIDGSKTIKCLVVKIHVEIDDGKKRKKEETISLKLFEKSTQKNPDQITRPTLPHDHAKQLDLLTTKFKNLEESCEKKFKASQQECTLQIAKLEQDHASHLAELKQEHAREVEYLETKIKDLEKKQKEEITKLKERCKSYLQIPQSGYSTLGEKTRILTVDTYFREILLSKEEFDKDHRQDLKVEKIIYRENEECKAFKDFFAAFTHLSERGIEASFQNKTIIIPALTFVANFGQVKKVTVETDGDFKKVRLIFYDRCDLTPNAHLLRYLVTQDESREKRPITTLQFDSITYHLVEMIH